MGGSFLSRLADSAQESGTPVAVFAPLSSNTLTGTQLAILREVLDTQVNCNSEHPEQCATTFVPLSSDAPMEQWAPRITGAISLLITMRDYFVK